MAAPGKPSASKWGSFLTSAVAGVESRLDNMLAEGAGGLDEDDSDGDGWTSQPKPKKPAAPQAQPQAQAPMTAAAAPAPAQAAKPASTPKARGGANDRLQARLAKAMAGKAQGSGSPRSSFDSRPSMERPSMERPSMERPSMERPSMERASTDSATPAKDEAESTPEEAAATPETTEPTDTKAEKTAEPTEAKTEEIPAQTAAAPSSQPIPEIETPTTTTAPKTDISNLARDMEEIKARQQEEIQEYVERIDSLQSKLKYLSRSAAESAKKTATGAPSGSTERKLAEKDEKIALLMEEGQKLSGSEQTLRTTIKRLRLQMAERDKQADEVKKARDKAIADADALRSRLEGDEGNEKRQEEARKATASLQREIDSLKKERAARDEAARKAEQDLRAKADAAAVAAADAHAKALADEKSRTRELEDELATVRADRDAIKDKARLDGLEWSERLERAAERARTIEADLRNEVRVMENKLESMRAVAEEASSGAGGDAQVKLLRQIETLQSQYTTASDNWQGIEASLLAKVAGLEKEKDEAARRESDMRKKARESASRCRILEEELQDVKPELETAKRELEACREELATLRTSAKTTETALEQARSDLDRMQRAAAREMQAGYEPPALPSPRNQGRPDSPLLSVPRNFSSDLSAGLHIFNKPSPRRTPVSGSSVPDSPGFSEIGSLRRLPSQPMLQRTSTLSTTGSGVAFGGPPPPRPFSPFDPPPAPPQDAIMSPSLAGRDEPSETDNSRRPSSPRNVAHDMVSVSTVGAGPSVQLVERMSAAIRRLEADKVAAKEEMARVCSQRDEARSDILGLMRDVEAAKAASSRTDELEKQLADVNARYQTTLELLGEKSELVEELKADVQDVKDMYRELVERTVK